MTDTAHIDGGKVVVTTPNGVFKMPAGTAAEYATQLQAVADGYGAKAARWAALAAQIRGALTELGIAETAGDNHG